MVKIGLRANNWPGEEEKLILIEHIVSNFGGNRIQEIPLAFEMAIAGKLDLKSDDAKCYENFSCAYFSTIMTSYQRWAAQAFNHLKPKEMPEQRIFTQDELDDSAREDAERQYQGFLKGFELKNTQINKAILEKDGLITKNETVLQFFERKAKSGKANIYVRTT